MPGPPFVDAWFSIYGCLVISTKPSSSLPFVLSLLRRSRTKTASAFGFMMADIKTYAKTLPKNLRILCFGDSLTAGYTMCGYEHHPYADHLRTSLEHMLNSSDVQVEVAGLSGDQVQGQYLRRIKAKCPISKEPKYDWIIIMGGTNDLGWGQQPETIYEGLSKFQRYLP